MRKVRTPQGAAVDNVHREQSQGKCHRKHTARRKASKGEKVGSGSGLNVRAHRLDGDAEGTANPAGSKAK